MKTEQEIEEVLGRFADLLYYQEDIAACPIECYREALEWVLGEDVDILEAVTWYKPEQ